MASVKSHGICINKFICIIILLTIRVFSHNAAHELNNASAVRVSCVLCSLVLDIVKGKYSSGELSHFQFKSVFTFHTPQLKQIVLQNNVTRAIRD